MRRFACVLSVTALVVLTGFPASAAPPTTATVQVNAKAFAPSVVRVSIEPLSDVKARVTWKFAAGPHSVKDATKMGLFNSGRKSAGGSYTYAFPSAGSYPYLSANSPNMRGRVDVPMLLTPTSGKRSTNFRVYWAAEFAPSGYNYQIQYRQPGSTVWEWFVSITGGADAAMMPSQWGNKTGTYSFRARLLKGTAGPSSNWSPIAHISVS